VSTFKTVLITGTHSGIGRGLLAHYHKSGSHVICINRREDLAAIREFPGADFKTLDITDYAAVKNLFKECERHRKMPDLIVLNAGVNKVDNVPDEFNYPAYKEVMDINLAGSMTFVGAARECGLKGVTFLGISSTSNIVANPGHIAYHLSKWGMHRAFELLRKQDKANRYKSVVLGPILTNITKGYAGPTGFQKKIFDFLAKTVDQLTPKLVRFTEGRCNVLYYPFGACVFYVCVRLAMKVMPGIYKGTQKK